MPITPIAWLLVFVGGCLLSFSHPIYGLMTYFFVYYQHPHYRWWGKYVPFLRYSFIISLTWLVAYLITHRHLPPLKVKTHPQSIWLVLFVVNTFIVSLTVAVWPEKTWESTFELLKFCILYFLMIGTIRTQKDFSLTLYTHIFGIFTWGWRAFTDPRREAGRLYGIGGPDSTHDNSTASVLLAILPFTGSLFFSAGKLVKGACSITAVFALNAFILCNSRGGTLGLVGQALLALKMAKGPMRKYVFLAMVAGGVVFVSLMDPQFINRQAPTEEYATDGSATGRIDMWKGALELSSDHPFGTGGGGYIHLSRVYIPEKMGEKSQGRSVHNTYLLALAEWGIQGLILFMGFILCTFYQLYDIRRSVPNTEAGEKIWWHSFAITLGLAGFLIAGIFTSRLMGETLYVLPALSAALKNLQVIESEKTTNLQAIESEKLTELSPR